MTLSAAAQKNIAAGGKSGPGTAQCRSCGGHKEPTRINSAKCRGCNGGPVSTALKVPLSEAVLAALTADAQKNNSTPAARAAFLLTRKYTPDI